MVKISVVIITLNVERYLETCLKSVRWVDEIVIVDDGSTDKTLEIARKYTDKIYQHIGEGYVEPSRNFAIEKAQGEWILVLDADEQIPSSLAIKLRELSESKDQTVAAISLPRKNIIFNKWMRHTGWWPDYNVRFFKKGSVKWSDKIHCKPDVTGPVLELTPKEEFAISHLNYESISQFLLKTDRYTTIRAKELLINNVGFLWKDVIIKPLSEFLSRFFLLEGYKDGLHGLALSLLQAFDQLILVLKVWETKKFEEVEVQNFLFQIEKEFKHASKDARYWFSNEKTKQIKNPLKKKIYHVLAKIKNK